MTIAIAAALSFLATALSTGIVRRYALARSLLDIPNDRSSHTTPVPRGGGIAIVATILSGTALLAAIGFVDMSVAIAVIGGCGAVAGVGWLDDHRGVSAATRALVHFGAAIWSLLWLGGLPTLDMGVASLPLGFAGLLLGAVGIVWWTNLFNFMDGIDGIAAGEAAAVGVGGGVLLLASGSAHSGLAAIAFMIAAASAGFLLWNWAPARIFMGDVGSGMLGFLFAILAIASENSGAVPLSIWVLLSGVFVIDATLTLTRRVARGERWYSAHASHAYQRAVQMGWSHDRVTSTVLAVNGLLVFLAWVAFSRPRLLPAACVVAIALLLSLYWLVERRRPMALKSP